MEGPPAGERGLGQCGAGLVHLHPGSLQCCDAEVPGEEVMGALEM